MKIFYCKILFLIFFSTSLFGFKKKKILNHEETNVCIYTDKNDTLIKTVVIEECMNQFIEEPFLIKKTQNKSNLIFSFKITESKFFKITSLKPQSIAVIIYVSPGDSISFNFEKNKLVFKGRNSEHYNFFNEIYDLNLFYPMFKEDKGVESFLRESSNIYNNKCKYLENCFNKNKVSNQFYEKTKEILKFEYINWVLNTNIIPSDIILNQEDYLTKMNININIFNRNDLSDNSFFHFSLINYLNIITEKKHQELYTIDGLIFKLNYAKSNLNGDIKEYAVFKIIFDFFNQIKPENKNEFKKIIDSNLSNIYNMDYCREINLIKQNLNYIDQIIPNEVLEIKLLNSEGKSISLKEILSQQGDKIKVFDFWASWCGPCIQEIKKSNKFRDELKNVNVIFIYLSIDKKFEAWKNKVTQLKDYGVNDNQYLISEKDQNKIKSFFNISTIPNYVILDSNNKIKIFNAPAPNYSTQFNNLIKSIMVIR